MLLIVEIRVCDGARRRYGRDIVKIEAFAVDGIIMNGFNSLLAEGDASRIEAEKFVVQKDGTAKDLEKKLFVAIKALLTKQFGTDLGDDCLASIH